jgi:hypothetical protein
MYRFQASVHHAAVQAFCLQQALGAACRDLFLGADANERGPKAQNRDRIAVCVHTLDEYQLRGREWLS